MRKTSLRIVLLLFLFELTGCLVHQISPETNVTWSVSHNQTYKYIYDQPVNEALRVYVERQESNLGEYPVHILIRQHKAIYVFQLPMVIDGQFIYWFMSRTLCPLNYRENINRSTYQLSIEITTDLPEGSSPTNGQLRIGFVQNFRLKMNDPHSTEVTPSEPHYFLFNFPSNVSSVDIRVSSLDNECMMMFVQNVKCPVHDELENHDSSSIYQTVSGKGFFRIRKETHSSFFLVFLLKANNKGCITEETIKGYNEPSVMTQKKRFKVVQFNLIETMSTNEYVLPIVVTFTLAMSFYVVFFAIIIWDDCVHRKKLSEQRGRNDTHLSVFDQGVDIPGSEATDIIDPLSTADGTGENLTNGHISQHDSPNISMNFIIDVPDSRKKVDPLKEKHSMFRRYIVVIAIFYGLPIIQLTLSYHRASNRNQDFCFHNFYCTRPLFYVTAFNNLFSNLFFIMLGFLFIFATWRKSRNLRRSSKLGQQTRNMDSEEYGFPEHFGIYYAMGLALIFEGIMSCMYHVCPSGLNYQFDTAFMYIMCALGMVRIYHSRHPKNNGTAHLAFTLLAVALLIGVVGGLEINGQWSNGWWILFCIAFFFVSLYVSVDIYYRGDWTLIKIIRNYYQDLRIFMNEFLEYRRVYLGLIHPRTLILLILGNVANFLLIVFMDHSNFFKFLLQLIGADILAYYLYYVLMKVWVSRRKSRHPNRAKEKIPWFVYVFLVAAFVSWVCAFVLFTYQRSYSWRKTPPESRSVNKDCILFNFYDGHDIWHFFSAMALFFTFMVTLHIDDDLVNIKRSKIAIF